MKISGEDDFFFQSPLFYDTIDHDSMTAGSSLLQFSKVKLHSWENYEFELSARTSISASWGSYLSWVCCCHISFSPPDSLISLLSLPKIESLPCTPAEPVALLEPHIVFTSPPIR